MPKQLPHGYSAESLEQAANTIAKGSMWVIIVTLLIQLGLKSSIEIMIELYCSLQLLKSISIIQVDIPANLAITLAEIRKIVDFEQLKPEFILGLFGYD